jgi:hypothetical protein
MTRTPRKFVKLLRTDSFSEMERRIDEVISEFECDGFHLDSCNMYEVDRTFVTVLTFVYAEYHGGEHDC